MSEPRKFAEAVDKETGEVLLECFMPGQSQDAISIGLQILTRQFEIKGFEVGGGMGGRYGYGVNFENEVFGMHQYCWCETNDGSCLWCLHGDNQQFYPLLHAKFGTTKENYGQNIYCYYDPPNFWHKASGFRVGWYKYIGRDMTINRTIEHEEGMEILKECIRSITGATLEDAVKDFDAAKARERENFERAMAAMSKITPEEWNKIFTTETWVGGVKR